MVNGFFCEFDKPVLCENIPSFQKIVRKINTCFDLRKFKPQIDKTSELFVFKDWRFDFEPHHGNDYDQKTFIDESSGLMYHFYINYPDSNFYMIVKKHDLATEFSNIFELCYYEQDKLPSKQFVKNLLKWTDHKNIDSFVKWLEKGWKKHLKKNPRPDWDGTMNKEYFEKLKKL